MSLPDISVELRYDGQWNDITADCLAREDIGISRGRADEASQADPSSCTLQINNAGGKYSPRNPESPLYGKISRNTPIRVRRGPRDTALVLHGRIGDYATTPDTASLDLTGDLDVRVEITPDSWRPDEFALVASKNPDGGALSWTLRLLPGGHPELTWSPDGSTRNPQGATEAVPENTDQLAVRAALDVDSGTNEVPNHDFETGSFSPWGVGNSTATVADTRAHTGTYSAEVTPDGTSERGFISSDFVSVAEGETVAASGWLWLTSASSSVSVSVNWFDSAKAYLATSEQLVSVGAGTWTELFNEFTAPSGTEFAQLVPTLAGTPPSSNVWHVDDTSLRPAQYTLAFYTGPSVDGPWTQLGDTIVGSSTTQVNANAADLALGALSSGDTLFTNEATFAGLIHAFQLRDGIDGAAVADVGMASADPGDSTITGANGLVWTVRGRGHLADRSVRFTGEVSEWPPRWDVGGNDVYTPISAAGILRRLGNASAPLRSALYRGTVAASPVAYWPMEDGENASTLASALDGDAPMSIVRTPKLAAFDGFSASEQVPTMQDGQLVGTISDYPASGEAQVQFMVSPPEGGIDALAQLVELRTTGSARRFVVELHPDGDVGIVIYGPTGDRLVASRFTLEGGLNGQPSRMSLQVTQNGPDVSWELVALREGDTVGSFSDGTLTGHTFGAMTRVTVGSTGLGDTAVGHVSARPAITSVFDLADETNAWRGEAAGRRVQRLCAEEGIPLRIVGDPDATAALGPQSSATLLDLLREAADADMGILGEQVDVIGLRYRTHESLYNRPSSLTLDYAAGQLAPPLEPTTDDQYTRNDITVSRRNGSSARAIAKTGPLSMLPPPDGVGVYDASQTLNVHTDDQLDQQAAWRLHLGTLDEVRYPTVTVDLQRNPDLADTLTRLGAGDRITLANIPDWLPPGAAELTVQGSGEVLNQFRWLWSANTSPARAHDVFELDSPTLGRLASDGSQLDADVNASTTSVPVLVTAGPQWTSDSAQLPLDVEVGGEVMTVTAVADGGTVGRLRRYGFEDGTLDPFTTSGDADWFVQSSDTNGSSYAAQSGNIADGQRTQLTLVDTTPEGGMVSFAFKTSSEQFYDLLEFYIDGSFQDEWSGALSWQISPSYWLAAGEHEFTWVYSKDGSVSDASDAAWVDDVAIDGPVQDFTVTRSTNGISKPHATAATVRLVDTAVLAIGQSGQL